MSCPPQDAVSTCWFILLFFADTNAVTMSLSRLASRVTVGTIARFGSAAPNCASRACVRLQPCVAQAPFAHGTRSGAVVPARTLATKGRI